VIVLVFDQQEGAALEKALAEIAYKHLDASQTVPEEFLPITLAEFERRVILRTLSLNGGNLSAAARILGISRQTLRVKLAAWQRETDKTDSESVQDENTQKSEP